MTTDQTYPQPTTTGQTDQAQREIWRKAPALIVEGVVQKRNGVVNFVAERVKVLAQSILSEQGRRCSYHPTGQPLLPLHLVKRMGMRLTRTQMLAESGGCCDLKVKPR